MSMLTTLFFSLFMLGMLGIILKRLHLLSLLLCLELLLVSLFLNLAIWAMSCKSPLNLIFPIILLTISACEASAGLALMVLLSRSHSTDLLTKMKLLQT